MEIGTDCQYEVTKDYFIVYTPKAVRIFTKNEEYYALKRGKSHRRHGGQKLRKDESNIPELYR